MGKELKNPELIHQKYAERIVDELFIDNENDNPESRSTRVDKVVRILNPHFEDVNQDIESSQIAAIAFDDVSGVLQIDFQTGSRYWYHGVEKDVVKQLTEAESKGKFFSVRIKPNYPYEQVS